MLRAAIFALAALWLTPIVQAQGDASLWPQWLPLAVRSPYLSAWMNSTNVPVNTSVSDALRIPSGSTVFQAGPTEGWSGLIRIADTNRTYGWLGNVVGPDVENSLVTDMQITPTRTILHLTAGPVDVTLTFLSPIEATDPSLQSLPFTYLSLDVASNDGLPHHVQIYSDIDAEWLSGDRGLLFDWKIATTDDIMYYQLQLQSPEVLNEVINQAEDDTLFWTMPIIPAAVQTYMIGAAAGNFTATGVLPNSIVNNSDHVVAHAPAFAFSVDLGSITTTTSPVVFALGMTRDPVVGYLDASGTPHQRSPYWASRFADAFDAALFVAADYPNAMIRAVALDQKIRTAAAGISAHYADVVSLAARQAMGGTELTIGRSSSDATQWNTSDVKMFMKNLNVNISETHRVNAVEGLYQAFPFFLFINTTYGEWLLEPILEIANTSFWIYPYAPRDIGASYPQATGNFVAHNQGVEQSGNMLIMILAHARATGNVGMISRYYALLKKWADYLVGNSFPLGANQISADSTNPVGDLTNLALKGIVGIKAMSEISAAAGANSDAQYYSNISSTFAAQWQEQAVSSDGQHILTSFGDSDDSFALTYNLFPDILLGTGLISSGLYASQTKALEALISSSPDGLPVDRGLPDQACVAWSMFAAAYTNDTTVQQRIIDQIWARVATNATDFGVFWNVYGLNGNKNLLAQNINPLIGGVYSLLALNLPVIAIASDNATASAPTPGSSGTGTQQPDSPSRHSVNVGAVVGGVVGGLGGVAILGLVGYMLWRRRHPRNELPETDLVDDLAMPPSPSPFPYQPESQPLFSSMTMSGLGGAISGAPLTAKQLETMRGAQPPGASVSAGSSATLYAPASDIRQVLSSSAETGAAAAPPPPVPTTTNPDVQLLLTHVEDLQRAVRNLEETGYGAPPEYRSEFESQ